MSCRRWAFQRRGPDVGDHGRTTLVNALISLREKSVSLMRKLRRPTSSNPAPPVRRSEVCLPQRVTRAPCGAVHRAIRRGQRADEYERTAYPRSRGPPCYVSAPFFARGLSGAAVNITNSSITFLCSPGSLSERSDSSRNENRRFKMSASRSACPTSSSYSG
jgi:hypothetical protein